MPKKTIALLDKLVADFGMTSEHFKQLHHMGSTISTHRNYSAKHASFNAGSGNHNTRARLRAAREELQRQADAGAVRDWPAAIVVALRAHPVGAVGGAVIPEVPATYILTWNPDKMDWADEVMASIKARLLAGESVTATWSLGSRRTIDTDARFVLLRLGREPKGIFATGRLLSHPRESEQWGALVDIEFDELLLPGVDPILEQSVLNATFPAQHWSPQGSGSEVKPEVAVALEQRWRGHLMTNKIAPARLARSLSQVRQSFARYERAVVAGDARVPSLSQSRYLLHNCALGTSAPSKWCAFAGMTPGVYEALRSLQREHGSVPGFDGTTTQQNLTRLLGPAGLPSSKPQGTAQSLRSDTLVFELPRPERAWLVQVDAAWASTFVEREYVSIDHDGLDVGDLSDYTSVDELLAAFDESILAGDEAQDQALRGFWDFARSAEVGEIVVAVADGQCLALGRIAGPYVSRNDDVDPHVRGVDWLVRESQTPTMPLPEGSVFVATTETALRQAGLDLGDTRMDELLTGGDLDALKKAWSAFQASTVERARVAVRRVRAKQIVEGFARGEYREVIDFERNVWQMESRTLVDGDDWSGAFHNDERFTAEKAEAFLEALQADTAELHGNYTWRHASGRFNPQRNAPEAKREAMVQIETSMNDESLEPHELYLKLQKVVGIGVGVASGLAMMKHPTRIALFNSIVPVLMQNIGIRATKQRDYQPIAEVLRAELGANDFIELDWFLFRLKYGVPSLWEGSGTTQPPPASNTDIYSTIVKKGFVFPDEVVTTYLLSLRTKPFVILSGISGTGKTKLAQIVAEWAGTDRVIVREAVEHVDGWRHRLPKTTFAAARLYIPRHVETLLDLPLEGAKSAALLVIGDASFDATLAARGPGRPTTLHYPREAVRHLEASYSIGDDVYIEVEQVDNLPILRIRAPSSETVTREEQLQRYAFLSVRPDWMDGKALLGFYNLLTEQYVVTRFLGLLLRAHRDPEKPYFVILDEMNLARVEHYFSDLLSMTESRTIGDDGTVNQEAIELHDRRRCLPVVEDPATWQPPDECASCGCRPREIVGCALYFDGVQLVPPELPVPLNLHITGTVNIDETTHMFSPKVLDRGNVIEFNHVDLDGSGATGVDGYRVNAEFALGRALPAQLDHFRKKAPALVRSTLGALNDRLESDHLHFGYRVASEIALYCLNAVEYVGADALEIALDLQLLQKVLPKFHGTRHKLEGPLSAVLLFACFGPEAPELSADEVSTIVDAVLGDGLVSRPATEDAAPAIFPRSAKKLAAMVRTLRQQGFVSFIE